MTQILEKPRNNIFSLSHVTALLSLLSITAVLSAVLYETGYFLVVSPTIIRQMQLGDYIANAISWLPLSIIILAMYLPFAAYFNEFFSKNQHKIPHESKKYYLFNFLNIVMFMSILNFITTFVYLLLIPYQPSKYQFGIVTLTFSVLFLYIYVFRINKSKIKCHADSMGARRSVFFLILVAPLLVFSLIGYGASQAYRDLSVKTSPINLEKYPDEEAVLLKSMNGGLLFLLIDSRKYVYLNARGLVIWEGNAPSDGKYSKFCTWTDLLCGPVERQQSNESTPP